MSRLHFPNLDYYRKDVELRDIVMMEILPQRLLGSDEFFRHTRLDFEAVDIDDSMAERRENGNRSTAWTMLELPPVFSYTLKSRH